MAALSVTNPTLLDLAKRSDPDGKIATVVEILNETNEILSDMSWIEGNLPTGHRTTIRSGLPTPTWRKLYGGVQPDKSETVQITDTCGMLEAYAEVDKALADLNGNTAAFRLSEDRAFIEGINQEIADTIIYGNEATEAEAFTGFGPRFNSLSANNSDNVINASGDSDYQSIWLVVWGPNTVHGIVPKGSSAGLQVNDKGQITIEDVDGNGGRMEAYRTHYRWDAGLTVRDWRYVVRVCNIDAAAISTTYTAGAFDAGPDLPDLMFQAMTRVQNLSMGRPAFYMSRTLLNGLRRQVSAKTQNSSLTMENVGGVMVERFHGIPIRRCDVLQRTETEVS